MGNYLTLQVETWSVMLPNTKRWNEDDMQQVQFVVREGRKGRKEGRREGRKEASLLQAEDFLFDWLSVPSPPRRINMVRPAERPAAGEFRWVCFVRLGT